LPRLRSPDHGLHVCAGRGGGRMSDRLNEARAALTRGRETMTGRRPGDMRPNLPGPSCNIAKRRPWCPV
jgi:hypothetical protein